MAGEERVTLLRPRAIDASKAPIENALEVVELAVLGKVSRPSPANHKRRLRISKIDGETRS